MTNCDSERGRPARRCRDYRKSGYATELYHHSMSAAQLRELLDTTVAGGFDVDEDLLRQPSRGVARIALARQVAMYLAHVACGLSKAETGRLFGRDRTTVHHACIVVEQRRDDRSFDHAIDHLERVVKIVAGTRRMACAN